MTVKLSLFAGAGAQFFTANGTPLAGGKLYTYSAGTTTPLATYTSISGSVANTNPIILNSAGRTPNEIWLTEGTSCKFVLQDSTDVLIGTYDDISGGNDFASQSASIYADFANTSNVAKGDALVGFKQSNESGAFTNAVSRTVHQKLQELISVKDFGAVGDGIADDTAAIQNALNAIGSKGGDVWLDRSGRYYIASDITIPAGVTLKGHFELPGKTVAGNNATAGFDLVGSSIHLSSTATIKLADGASLVNTVVIRYGMSFPSTDSSFYAGVAITINGDDAYVGYVAICGFDKGIYSSGYQRPHFEWLYMDNNNGIEITSCGDVARLNDVHMWPFGVYPNANPVKFQRSGTGIYLHDSVDGPMLVNCFTYGYLIGFKFSNVASISVVNCFADNTGQYTNSVGWQFLNNINGFQAASCVAYSCYNGINVNMNSTQYIKISGFSISGSTENAIYVEGGNVDYIGNSTYQAKSIANITSAASIVRFDYNTYAGITAAAIIAPTLLSNVFIGANNSNLDSFTTAVVGGAGSVRIHEQASASTLALRSIDTCVNVTGTTNITGISGGWAGRIVVLRFTGVLTVSNNTSGNQTDVRLAGSVNLTTAANTSLTIMHDGQQWYEIARVV